MTNLRFFQSWIGCFVWFLLAQADSGQTASLQIAVRALDKADARRAAHLAGYTVTEEYVIRSSRFNKSAAMTVETMYRRGQGKSYRIVARSGSPMLQTRVFDRLLQEEAEMSHGEARQRASVNSENYVIRLAGEENRVGRRCYVLELTPRAKSAHLLRGQAWIDQEDGSLIRIEGKPTASPSFLAGRPAIVRDYEKVGDFWLAKSSHAMSDSFFFGTTELSISYVDYHLLSEESRP